MFPVSSWQPLAVPPEERGLPLPSASLEAPSFEGGVGGEPGPPLDTGHTFLLRSPAPGHGQPQPALFFTVQLLGE